MVRRLADGSSIWSVISRPKGQPALEQVCHTLRALAPYVRKLRDSPDWLASAAEEAREQKPTSLATGLVKNPLHGYITDHPVYAALWHQPQQADEEPVRRAQAAFLVAVALRPEVGIVDYPSALRDAGLAIRRLTSRPALLQLARSALLQPANSLKDIESNLQSCIDGLDATHQESIRLLSGLARLIFYALQEGKPRHRSTGAQVQRRLRVTPGDQPDDVMDMLEEISAIDGAKDQEERSKLGAAPVRESPPRRHATIGLYDSGASALGDRERLVQAKTRARALATAAQRLPFAGDRLQLLDLEVLLGWLQEPDTHRTRNDKAVATLLVMMLLTGSSVHRAKSLRISDTLPQTNTITDPYLTLNPLSLCLPTLSLKNPFRPSQESAKFYRSTFGHLVLPVPKSFPGMDRLLQLVTPIRKGGVFDGQDKYWEGLAKKTLADLNGGFGSRLTLNRIAEFLPRMVADLVDDHAEGALFSDATDSTGSAARLYYYAPRLSRLVADYKLVWDSVVRGGELKWSWENLPSSLENECVGSAGCPHDEAIRQVVDLLRKQTIELSRGRRNAERSIRFHNQLTAYTALMTMWTGGLRAIKDPIEVELIDPIQGLLAVSEKDSDNYTTSRVVPLPAVTLKQLLYYSEHKSALLAQADWLGLCSMPQTWLFFIDEKKPAMVTPARLMDQVGLEYLLHPNSQRHYLRTRLRESGVPGSYVDALLGHGAAGEEPYGRYSCLSPAILGRYITPPLTELIEKMGWQPIHGFGA